MEVASGWALEFSRLIVLEDFNVHVDEAASSQAIELVSPMVTLGLSQIVSAPMH